MQELKNESINIFFAEKLEAFTYLNKNITVIREVIKN